MLSAQWPQAGPVRPSWKSKPMLATRARRPFAISAARLDGFAAASLGVSALQPKPLAAAAVPPDWSRDSSLKAQ